MLNAGEMMHLLNLNLIAAMTFTAQFLAVTKGFAGARRVLNISSGAARRPIAGWAAYCTSKAALDMATRCAQLDEQGNANPARFVSLAPGVIDTDMQAGVRSADQTAFPDLSRFVEMKAKGELSSAQETAKKVLAYLERPDFGQNPIADVRDA